MFINFKAIQRKCDFYEQEINLSGGIPAPYEMDLHNGFPPGSELVIIGCVHDKAERSELNNVFHLYQHDFHYNYYFYSKCL